MLTALLFLLASWVFGVALVRRLRSLCAILAPAEQLMWGLVGGWTLTTVGIYLAARSSGRLSYSLVLATTLTTLVLSIVLAAPAIRQWRQLPWRSLWRSENLGLALVLALFTPVYLQLFNTHILQPGPGGVYSGGSTFSDIGFHAALTTSFVYGHNFPPIYTPLAYKPLLYPFLPDFQTAILMSAGLNLRAAMLVTALPVAIAITGLFYSFALRLMKSQRIAVVATILFLLNGGLGFIDLLRDWWKSGQSLWTFWSSLPLNYANIWDRGIHWNNLIVDTFLPQRTFLYGLSLGLLVLTIFAVVWRDSYEQDSSGEAARTTPRALLIIAGVLTGLLPLFHTHTYVALGLISIVLFLLRPQRAWLAFWIPAIALALPHLWTLTELPAAMSALRIQSGWMGSGESNYPLYLARNFGVPLIVVPFAWTQAPPVWKKFYLAFVGLFVFSLIVVISPNLFDNGKLIYYWHAMTSVLVAGWLVKLATVWRQLVIAIVVGFTCIASGAAALQHERLEHSQLFSDEDISAAAFVREHTPPGALFLTAPSLQQPVLLLAGRAIVRGNTAWLWSHGYEFRERESDVKRIYAGDSEALELLRYYHVDYVFVGRAERQELHANTAFFDQNLIAFYRTPDTTIYQTPAIGSPSAHRAEPAPRELAARFEKDPYYFLIEFPEISYAVVRMYRVAFGRVPRYHEFMSDLKVVGQGLFVNSVGWKQVLKKNNETLAQRWVERTDFKIEYDAKSNEEYVAALLANVGQADNAAAQSQLSAQMNQSALARSSVLLRISEGLQSNQSDYNAAYVLVHYFAYLQRNPEDAPDTDLTGFNYWLNNLNRTGDYRSLNRVFLESDEYRNKSIHVGALARQ